MKFEIDKEEDYSIDKIVLEYPCYLTDSNNLLNSYFRNLSIAKYLNIDYNQLFSIVNKYDIIIDTGECYFKNYNDCKNCVEELESYLVMEELIER